MKRVRFEFNKKNREFNVMDELECQYPRPFITREREPVEINTSNDLYSRILQMKSNPLAMYEISNSSPQTISQKPELGSFPESEVRCLPTNELELSILDTTTPRKSQFCRGVAFKNQDKDILSRNCSNSHSQSQEKNATLSSIENTLKESYGTAISMTKNDSFFIKRDNRVLNLPNILHKQFTKLNVDKENNPKFKKAEIMDIAINHRDSISKDEQVNHRPSQVSVEQMCYCHHCKIRTEEKTMQHKLPQERSRCQQIVQVRNPHLDNSNNNIPRQCLCTVNYCIGCLYEPPPMKKNCHCRSQHSSLPQCFKTLDNNKQNPMEKKILAIQRYEESKKVECTDIERPTVVVKEKREPTVADLFKIIKLQNEQLQLLQEKVDKFITAANNPQPPVIPVQNYVTEQIAVQAVGNDHQKISIGVMTSFEMYQTSTVINKETVKQSINNNKQNAYVQCNRSQISIKEVAFREPVNLNFLDGIQRKNSNTDNETNLSNVLYEKFHLKGSVFDQPGNAVEEKTVNDISLCNVQVDNVTTPMISPEQTMNLDVRDYSESDSGSDNQSDVGWTYYNKVMTNVNGILQDSEMPSSASALYRNTRQKCIQMQIDKTNISVTKRVKFGDDPLGLQQPHLNAAATTDTSMKMNQLAAKYLKQQPQSQVTPRDVGNAAATNEMSFATRNYMERHQILHGLSPVPPTTATPAMPRFLDITALKHQQQYKFS